MLSGKKKEVNICEVCHQPAQNRCASCLLACYCSKEHQKQHWKSHKNQCIPFQIKEYKDLGRCLIALRDIGKGEIVLREAPLVRGPPQSSSPVCLGCHNLLTHETAIPCPKCGWPMCSTDCSENPIHIPECSWAIEKRKDKVKISQFITPHPSYAIITPIRALFLKDNHPALWKSLITLESHCKERKQSGDYEQDRFSVATFVQRFYKLNDFSEEEILKICGILQINGHEVPLAEPPFITVYWKTSFLEHSCLPNCAKTFTDFGDVIIRAAVDIKKGSHLQICYTDPVWSTTARRQHLSLTKFFSCMCERCIDPTENGSYFSGVRCNVTGCDGIVLPKCFVNDFKIWRCLKCGNEMPAEKTIEIYSKVAEELSLLQKDGDALPYLDAINRIRNIVGENFCQLVEIKLTLAQMIGQSELCSLADLDENLLKTKEILCKELISLTEAILPAEQRIRGTLYFELHLAVAELARRQLIANASNDFALKKLSESGSYLERVLYFLKYEPSLLGEGKVYAQALQHMNDLQVLLKSRGVNIGI